MPATLTEEKILRRLEVSALFISFAPFLFSPMFSCINRKSPLFPGFCSRPTEKKQFLVDVSKTVFMPICSIISCLCVGGTLVFSYTAIIRRIIVSRTMTI